MPVPPRLRPMLALACILMSTFSAAQTHKSQRPLPPEAFKLIAIQLTGSKRYKSDDIARATGLQIGETVHEDDLRTAARHLGESGAFSKINYTFEYSPEGTKVEFQVQDSEKFVPARFENFVWFSDEELKKQLRDELPLFDGELPISGELAGLASEVLQALLLEKKVAGTVDYERVSNEGGPTDAIAFRVSGGPRILIRDVEFSGAAPPELPLLQAAAKKLGRTEYSVEALRVQVEKNFLPVYFEQGYLQARFSDPQPKLAPKPQSEFDDDNENVNFVDVNFEVDPGHEYKLSGLDIQGFKTVPNADPLHALIPLKVGDTANGVALEKGTEAIKQFYGARGNIEAAAKAEPEFNDNQFTVKYRIVIKEGDVFKMGDLEIQSPDSKTTERLQNEWTMRAGDVYDSSYPKKFATKAYKDVLTTGEWKFSVHENVNHSDKSVDVTVRFDLK